MTLPSPDGVELRRFRFEVATLDESGEVVDRRIGQARAFEEDLGGGVALEMVEIPGGSFLMGSPEGEADREECEGPRHRRTVEPFFVGKFPVTQAQWRAVAALPRLTCELNPHPSGFEGASRPVEGVSWHEAVEFGARLSRKTGRAYRLPSEAEWEYAARAGTTGPFHFGETVTPALVNYNGRYPYGRAAQGSFRRETTAVGHFRVANPFGLYDVHGNVWEWTQDVWHENYAGAPEDGRARDSAADEWGRVVRGGSWIGGAWECRCAYRDWLEPQDRAALFGFRAACAMSPTA